MQVKDQAICLRTVSYSETSQIVTLLTAEHGKIGAMAKGSRRKKSSFDGPIEIFSFGEVMFTVKDHGGQLAILTEFTQQPRFRAFATNLKILNAGLFAAELTESFLEDHDPHPTLFVKLIKFLETLQEAESDEHILAWLILYQLRLLEETGVELSLDECINCGTSMEFRMGIAHPTIYFTSRNNGILCGG
ncbi:MAG: DNA repair protein RecO, partial [Planctomycetota bacterium]